jgi:hypothetical protein
MMELDKAAEICQYVAEQRARWGRHSGFGQYSDAQVLDALLALADADLFSLQGEKELRIKANRRAGAAEAREKKSKARIAELESTLDELDGALKAAEADLKEYRKMEIDLEVALAEPLDE